MLKPLMFTLFLFASSLCFASSDALHLGGEYLCDGYDKHDGAYSGDILTLTLDKKQSDFSHNFGAYHFQLAESDKKVVYVGEVVASGNTLAIYFRNIDPLKSSDAGVGIAVMTHDRDSKGKEQTVLHKFYYEPDYQGGGNGSETCVKK